VPAPENDGPLPPRNVVSAGSLVRPSACGGPVYTGIGATVNRAGFIIDLAPDGPAQRAGLQPGDAILNLEDLPINTYPAGHPVGLRLLRDGSEMAATVRIDAICDEPEAPVA
jgi:S1-C subfamily serine protease